MNRVNVEAGRFRERSLVLPVVVQKYTSGRPSTYRQVQVKLAPYTSESTPGRREYAGRLGDTVYCEETFPDEWLEYVKEEG